MAHISVVIPVYNEQECLGTMLERLQRVQSASQDIYEFIFVDDGSSDATSSILRELALGSEKVKYISFSRNFGHEAALTAGLDHAGGDAVVTLDGDLQHPPELIPELMAKWREGFQIVYARRGSSEGLPPVKKFLSKMFYRAIRRACAVDLPADTANFRLMDRRVVQQYRRFREHERFGRGLVAWTGFKHTSVDYQEEPRYAGTTKYSTLKSARLAVDAFMSFSAFPVRLNYWTGGIFLACSAMVFVVGLVRSLAWDMPLATPAIVASMFFVGGVILLMLGVLGGLVQRVYHETRNRPLYVVADKSPSLPSGNEGASNG